MQELEKILREIEAEFDRRIDIQLKIMAGLGDDVYRYGYGKSLEAYQQGKLFVEDIIRKHMNDGQCGECSRRKWYQKGYEDGEKDNDGWISVNERLPEEKEWRGYDENRYCAYMKRMEVAYMTDTLEYDFGYFDGYKWMDKRYDIIKNVVAWKIHEPYRPERSEE